jgi:metallo-beta-lactamase class B
MTKILKGIIVLFLFIVLACSSQKKEIFKPIVRYQTETLIITQVSENAFQHTSYKQTNEWGKVPCNGLIVRSEQDVLIFDTPTNDSTSEALIQWIDTALQCKIKAVIPTHFHDDCLGGLQTFHNENIPSYAYYKTITAAQEHHYTVPQHSFKDSMIFRVGAQDVWVKFFGEGHTRDNVVGYYPSEGVLFGGCLIKELNAGKGYLGDAHEAAWSSTVEKIKNQFSNVKVVVPGHGALGDQKLLDYTIHLFKAK